MKHTLFPFHESFLKCSRILNEFSMLSLLRRLGRWRRVDIGGHGDFARGTDNQKAAIQMAAKMRLRRLPGGRATSPTSPKSPESSGIEGGPSQVHAIALAE